MYRLLRGCYRAVDVHLVSRFSQASQLRVRGWALGVGRRLFPGKALVPDVAHLMGTREQPSAWLAPELPSWVYDEMRGLAGIDPDLHPEDGRTCPLEYYSAPWLYDAPGMAYADMRRQVVRPVDIMLIVPWLKTGGADLGAIHFANTLAKEHGKQVLVVATEVTDSPWRERLHPKVQFLDAGAALAAIPGTNPADGHRVLALVRLILQLAPGAVHVMNSLLGWEAIRSNGLALSQTTSLYASLYCDDYTEAGVPMGYARTFLPSCYEVLRRVLTDNSRNYREWVRAMGVPTELFEVVPYPAPMVGKARDTGAASNRILWAGRLDRQKRPDLLGQIALRLPEFHFEVYGGMVVDKPHTESPLVGLPNVTCHGSYDGFSTISGGGYLAYLYTTAWDGLPNVLLEAVAAGLPVVAPDVGGISDLIPAGHLVAGTDNVEGYCNALRSLHAQPALRERWLKEQFATLAQGRSQADFAARIAEIPGYLGAERARDAVALAGA
jgi:glycosyltransferase involved in cell wall biosynthesis